MYYTLIFEIERDRFDSAKKDRFPDIKSAKELIKGYSGVDKNVKWNHDKDWGYDVWQYSIGSPNIKKLEKIVIDLSAKEGINNIKPRFESCLCIRVTEKKLDYYFEVSS